MEAAMRLEYELRASGVKRMAGSFIALPGTRTRKTKATGNDRQKHAVKENACPALIARASVPDFSSTSAGDRPLF
jgi:hypothetical protein